jgi:uncharacterized protein with NAD-binding domain and iron-sulfur cluster
MNGRVVVLGGGIGGMTAAQELVERGFRVDIFELKVIAGGKSRTIPVPGSGTGGRADLPGEHGFRFFPSFYMHLPDSMKRIPFGDAGKTCFDNLVPTTRIELAQYDLPPLLALSGFPESLKDLEVLIGDLSDNIGLLPGEAEFFAERMWQVMTECDERRLAELELVSWWDFVGAATRSKAYQKFLAQGLSRSLVAARAEEGSARTIGQIQVRLAFGALEPGASTDRVLNGPTSPALLEPWLKYLRSQGVRYFNPWEVTGIQTFDGRIVSIGVRNLEDGSDHKVEADWFVSALPIEVFAPLITDDMARLDPALGTARTLGTNVRWMNGIQFYLTEDVAVTHGHVLYVDSPWAITSISQQQFWPGYPLPKYGDARVKGVLSVDISDWDSIGTFIKTAAKDCETRDQIAKEVWAELKKSLNVGGTVILRDDMLHSWFLDTDIVIPDPMRPRKDVNLEPLFINKPASWALRPPAASTIRNFFLAADYVQTGSDLACMEAANEAARRAVNALLSRAGSSSSPCRIWDMSMPEIFLPWRAVDQVRYWEGLPWTGEL